MTFEGFWWFYLRGRGETVRVMANDDDIAWPPFPLAREFQEAGEEAFERQIEFMRRFMSPPAYDGGFAQLGTMSRNLGSFKTRVQSGGRISIPDAEREALQIEEGDIVQTVVIPMDLDGDSDG